MANIEARAKIRKESKVRLRGLIFGEPITNICAGHVNYRHCYFVEKKKYTIKCTDKKGRFFDIDSDVIYKGHLNDDKCKELFEPVWQAEYGE